MAEDDFSMLQVLVVDDQKAMRSIIRNLLKQVGIDKVEEAANGEEALKWLQNPRANDPDVIITDLYMDGMDGIELCNKIRLSKIPGVRDIPVLMLTGESDDFILKVSKQVGVFKILSKPIGAPELKKHISSALGYQI